MSGRLRVVLRVLLVFYFVAFVGSLLYSIVSFPPRYPRSLQWSFALSKTLVLFTTAMTGLTAGAGLCAFSLFVRDVSAPFHQLVRSTIAFFLVLTAVYTVLVMGVVPGAERRLVRLEGTSERAASLLEKAEGERRAGRFDEALAALEAYDRIDPGNEKAEKIRADITEATARQPGADVAVRQTLSEGAGEVDRSAASLLRQAQSYYDAGDFFSAQYYASLALLADESFGNARRIVALAWKEISAETKVANKGNPAEKAAAQLLQSKREAYQMWMQGDFVIAYYLFKALHSEHPDDPEIAEYLAASLEKAREMSFFVEDAQGALEVPGSHAALFVNRADEQGFELIAIDRIVRTDAAVFFEGVEVMRVEPPGTVALHLHARLGKLMDSNINLNAIAREGPSDRENTTFLIRGDEPADLPLLVELRVDPSMLEHLQPDPAVFRTIPLPTLWSIRGALGDAGIVTEAARVQLVEAFARPPSFLLLCLLGVGLGWKFRARYLRGTSVIAYLFVPLVPVAVWLLSQLYLAAQGVLFGFIAVVAGLVPALVALGSVQLILFAIVLVVIAGQSAE